MAIGVLLIGIPPPARAQGTSAPGKVADDSVWFWFMSCGKQMLNVEVRFDHRLLIRAAVPICKAPRNSTLSGGQQGTLDFNFVPSRAIVWTGYRSDHDVSAASVHLTGSVWEAGADPEDLLLGVVFMGPSKIMMNTIHVAHPAKSDTTIVARGLVVITYPAKARE